MALALGCIGDDYTGSSDLANALTRAGLRTIQTIGVPPADLDLATVDAVVIALKSRSVPAGEAVAMTMPAHAWLRQRGAAHILFKICSTFDSTDSGNIGPVMDALCAADAAPFALVSSAFPETRRTIYRGNLFVGDLPLHESPLKDHPLNPMHDANIVRVLGRQSRAAVGLVGLDAVEAGTNAILARTDALRGEGCGAAIVDCVFDRHLAAIGRAAIGFPLSVGASGLGIGLATALIAAGTAPGIGAEAAAAPIGGPLAMLSGSCSAATLDQIARAEEWAQVRRLDPERLLTDPGETRRAIDWALATMRGAPILIASSASPDRVRALQSRHGAEAAGRAIEDAMATIAEAVVSAGARRLVVAGGETSGAVVDRLGHRAFAIGGDRARRPGAAHGGQRTGNDARAQVGQLRGTSLLCRCRAPRGLKPRGLKQRQWRRISMRRRSARKPVAVVARWMTLPDDAATRFADQSNDIENITEASRLPSDMARTIVSGRKANPLPVDGAPLPDGSWLLWRQALTERWGAPRRLTILTVHTNNDIAISYSQKTYRFRGRMA